MFVWVPFVMMGSFWYLKATLEFELTPEKHNFHGKFRRKRALLTTSDTCYFSYEVQQT